MAENENTYGVYKNRRLMHACTTIVGFTVHLQTKDGAVYEGIFNTFSPEFTICLELAVRVNPKSTTNNSKDTTTGAVSADLNSKDCLYAALKSGLQAEKQAFFHLKDIVRITAVDVDLNYAATKDKLITDADISGFDANKLGEQRQLESWQDDDGDNVNADSMLSLDEVGAASKNENQQGNSTSWDAEDMFRYNERVHKVTTTYDEKLTDYTLPLPKQRETKDWKKKQERAEAIAKEIEGNSKSQGRLAKEDEGDCEEEKYSAVIRPTPQAPPPQVHRPMQNRMNSGNQNGTHKGFQGRPRFNDRSRIDSLKNFAKHLNIAPSPKGSPNQDIGQVQTQSQTPPISQNQLKPPQPHQPIHHHQPQKQQQQQQSQQQQQPPQPQQQQSQQQSQHQQHPNQQSQQSQQHQQSSPQIQSGSTQQSQTHHQQQKPQQTQQQQQNPPQNQSNTTTQQSQTQQSHPQKQPPQQVPTTQIQTPPAQTPTTISNPSPTTTTTSSNVNTSTISERSDTSSVVSNQVKDHQSELARKSKLNPNAKEFVYKPRSPANWSGQANGANLASASGTTAIDPANPNPMPQAPHTPYYQPMTMFPLGISPHQQQHHAAQFMPNHTHFQNQIHYMSPVPPHFVGQNVEVPQAYNTYNVPQRYIRGSFQNYHHRGEVRAEYTQPPMMVPTSTGQPFVTPPSGAPHAYASQQPMIYSGPPQSMYPVVLRQVFQ